MITVSDHPDIKTMMVSGGKEPEMDVFGYCAHCGNPIYKSTGMYEGDVIVNDYGTVVHWDCWYDYGKKMREQL